MALVDGLALVDPREAEVVICDLLSGGQPRAFAVVEVIRRQEVVVPVDRLRVMEWGREG